MRYKITQGPVYDGHVDLDVRPIGDVCQIAWKLKARIGTKVWGRFIGKTVRKDGNLRIDRKILSESFMKKTSSFSCMGAEFTKKTDTCFSFNKKGIGGKICIGYDGLDPIEINKVEIDFLGGITLEKS